MGEIFVKKNNAFERVVSDGNTVIVQGGGGGSGVTIAFYAYRAAADGDTILAVTPSSTIDFPGAGSGSESVSGGGTRYFRYLSAGLDRVLTNTNSINNGQSFNPETGEFTAPVAGVYRFSAMAVVRHTNLVSGDANDDSTEFSMWLRKNPPSASTPITGPGGSDSLRIGTKTVSARSDEQAVQSTDWYTDSATWEVQLNAGDRIRLAMSFFDKAPSGMEVHEASFSGSYVGGASVTPRDPVAMYATVGRALIGTENPNNPSGSGGLLPKIYRFDGQSTRVCNQIFLPTPYSTFVESMDKSNAFNPTTGVFVAPVKGVYSIGFDISLSDFDIDNGHWYSFWIQKTGASVIIPESPASFRGNPLDAYANDVRRETKFSDALYSDQNYQWLVEMEAGEKITWHMLGTNTDNNVTAIRLSAHLLTSTQTIDPPLETPVSVYAHSNVRDSVDGEGYSNHVLYGQGIFRIRNGISVASNRTFTLNELVDTSGSFDVNTGVFTAPLGGLYSITAYAEMQDGPLTYGGSGTPSSNLYATMWIRKTPVGQNALVTPTDFQDPQRYGQLVRVSPVNNSETHHMAGDWLVQMNEGDQITWYANPNQLDNTAFGNKIQSIAISANLITPTDRNIKMSRGSAPAMVANSPDCGQILLTTTAKRIKNSELVTISENPAGMTTPPAENCAVGVFAEDIDTHTSFDPTTGIYTAPMKGLYEIQMSFNHFEFASGVYSRYWIEKTAFGVTPPTNGTYTNAINHPIEIASIDAGTLNNSGFIPYSKKWLVELEAGDMITWHTARDTNTGTIISRNITLSAHLLTSTETVFSDGNPDVLFAFHTKNTAETANGTSVVLSFAASTNVLLRTGNGLSLAAGSGVEVTDLTSSFDPATGKFTAPVSGWYELDGQVDWFTTGVPPLTSYGRLFVWMEKNNTTNNPLVSAGAASDADAATNLIGRRVEDFSNTTWNTSTNIRNTVYLSQGETVSLCVYGSMTSSAPQITHWSFSGKRIPPVNSSSGIGAGTVYSDYSATENGWTRIAPGVIMQWGREQVPNTNQNNFATGGWDVNNSSAKKRIVFGKQFAAIPWSFTVSTGIPTASAFEYDFVAQSQSVGPTGSTILFNLVSSGDGVYNGLLNWIVIGPG